MNSVVPVLMRRRTSESTTEPHSHVCLLVFCSTKDQIVMVNGVTMENVHSNYTIQILKSCGKTANVVSIEEAPKLLCDP